MREIEATEVSAITCAADGSESSCRGIKRGRKRPGSTILFWSLPRYALGGSEDWKLERARQTTLHYWLFVFSGTFKGSVLHLIKFQLVPWLKWVGVDHLRSLIRQVTFHLPAAVDAKIQRNQ